MDDNWVAAYEALWRGAGKGGDLAASLLGRIYLTGIEEETLQVAPNPNLAKVILDKACRAGGKYSCLTLSSSRLVPPREQHRLQKALCEAGNMVEACEAIVARRANDRSPEALPLFERACRLGSPGGCKARIEFREREFRASPEIRELQHLISRPAALVTKEEEARITELRALITRFEEELDVYKRAACYRGDSESCLELAERNLKTKNFARAKAFLEIGIDDPRLSKDRSECLVELARLYHEGKGVKKDSVRALDLLEKACPTSSKACQLGGEIALGAGGAKRNVERARSFYGRLCDDGRILGCEKVSELNTVIAKR
jgi:TPR repeat protein